MHQLISYIVNSQSHIYNLKDNAFNKNNAFMIYFYIL